MTAVKKLAIGAVGVAALVGVSAPAAAQYPGYPGYGGYNQPANVIGQVLQTVLNPYGNRQAYGINPQMATQQCAAAVQQRLARSYSSPYAYGYGYNGYAPSQARVMQVTRLEQRSSTTMRVRGTATSGRVQNAYGPYGAGAYGSVGYAYAQPADLTFKCDVDYRGRIRDIDINRRY